MVHAMIPIKRSHSNFRRNRYPRTKVKQMNDIYPNLTSFNIIINILNRDTVTVIPNYN